MQRLCQLLLVVVAAGLVLCSCSSSSSDKTGGNSTGDGSPAADFVGSPRSGDSPLEVSFTSTCTGTITSYSWDFGDGQTSSAPHPQNSYVADGVYNVTLTVVGPGGSDTETKVAYITCGNPPGPTVDFEAAPRLGQAPLTVKFNDLSSGNTVHTWSWDFGDRGNSTEQNPEHTYTVSGTYDVTLTATDLDGTKSLTKTAYIEVTEVISGPLTKFTDLGVIYSGQAVNDMHAFNGKLYIATATDPLGSFGCALSAYDGSNISLVFSVGASQGLPRIREIDGKLYVPDGDPNGLTPGYVYISDATGGSWSSTTVPTGAHLFDVIKLNSLIYLSGQDGAPGVGSLWSSSNGGSSFTLAGSKGNGRHKYMVKYGSHVFISLEGTGHVALNASNMQPVSSPIGSTYYAWRWRVINGVLYAGGGVMGPSGYGCAIRYDGTNGTVPAGFEYAIMWDFCEFGGKIYCLAVDGLYESTDNGNNFSKIIDAPAYGSETVFWMLPCYGGGWNQDAIGALAVYDGNFYAGSIRNGHLYRIE
jgi:PKD repeat protein